MTTTETLSTERADLLSTLTAHRGYLRQTVRGLTDEQATLRTTPSELCLGGLIKHVAAMEAQWAHFIVDGPSDMNFTDWSDEAVARFADGFRLLDGETLAGVLEEYDRVAAATDRLVRTLPDLDAGHPLPQAPWWPGGGSWSARRALLHIVAETAQHAGHADIIREALDGQKTMG